MFLASDRVTYIIFEFRNLQVTTLDSLSNLSLLFILYVFHHNELLNGKTYTRGSRGAGCRLSEGISETSEL